ncbi:Threonine--tRNA ligase 2 [archaeon HR01]|nr:Threonine--tRNA ligase 2 [archaeon HR01]
MHVDFIEYRPVRKEIELAEESDSAPRRYEEALVVFVSVEPEDDESVADMAVEDVYRHMSRLKVGRLVIYPFAHLARELARPEHALEVVRRMEERAKTLLPEVYRAPFGWNKALSISVKGHPLAEMSRVFTKSQARTPEVRTASKTYLILTPEGDSLQPEMVSSRSFPEEFRILVEREALGLESPPKGEPEYIRVLKRLGIDWEEMSDLGHMRYGPDGTLVFDLISDYADRVVQELGIPVYRVRGTNLFSLESRPIREHAGLFGQRMYKVEVDGRQYVMRYAACFQQFALARNWVISYKHLPFGAFEIADSYRLEQSGELVLGFRVRKMTMPDLHIFCRDIGEAMEIFKRVHDKIYSEIEKLGRDYVSLYNLTSRRFYEGHRDFFRELVAREGKPVLLSFYPEDSNYYWVLNIEYHIIDKMGRPREIGTVQLDTGNAERFGIVYTDREGAKAYPVILHTALIGTVERYLYTVLDTALQSKPPTLPVWLSPTQVRVIPVSEKYLSHARKIALKLSEENIRADLDDRSESLSKKIFDAETAWIPYIAVVGEREARTGRISVRERRTGKQVRITLKGLVSRISSETKGYPFRPLRAPLEVSKRPIYSV